MPRMYCQGTSIEIPSNGKICPNLPTNLVPLGRKCEIKCDSGSSELEYIKCDKDGWPVKEVVCGGTSAGLIVGLLVGGIIVVCIIAFVYAKMKARKQDKKDKNAKVQSVTRAAKIAAKNDMVVTGVVTRDTVKAGVVDIPDYRPNKGKLVTVEPQSEEYRRSSSSSRNLSNPPSYHSIEAEEVKQFDATNTRTSKSRGQRGSRTTGSDHHHKQKPRKHRSYFNEYTENVELGYGEEPPVIIPDGQYHLAQDTGPMHPDYYGPASHAGQNRYGAMDQSYYGHDMRGYYMNPGHDNMAYSNESGYNQQPYHVPI